MYRMKELENGGTDHNDDYSTAKIVVQNVDELIELVKEAVTLKVS